MPQRRVTVRSASGLHARPAATFTRAALDSGLNVTIAKGEASVNASSLLLVMSLGVHCGDEVLLTAEGPQAERVLDSLADLLGQDLDAEPLTS